MLPSFNATLVQISPATSRRQFQTSRLLRMTTGPMQVWVADTGGLSEKMEPGTSYQMWLGIPGQICYFGRKPAAARIAHEAKIVEFEWLPPMFTPGVFMRTEYEQELIDEAVYHPRAAWVLMEHEYGHIISTRPEIHRLIPASHINDVWIHWPDTRFKLLAVLNSDNELLQP